MKYKHLTPQQRYAISVMLQRPMTMAAVALGNENLTENS